MGRLAGGTALQTSIQDSQWYGANDRPRAMSVPEEAEEGLPALARDYWTPQTLWH